MKTKKPSQRWIIGKDSIMPITHLRERYWQLYIERHSPTGGNALPANLLRWNSLGLSEKSFPAEKKSIPQIITDRVLLAQVENNFRSEDGYSLQGLVYENINSRILVEVGDVFPEAQGFIDDAISYLSIINPWIGDLLVNSIFWIIPLYHENFGRPFRRAFSNANLLGAIFFSFVERKNQDRDLNRALFAVDLAHELGHQNLMLYQHSDPIISSNPDQPIYSSVRRTNRPAILSFHACVAAAYMIDTLYAVLTNPLSNSTEKAFAENSLVELLQNQNSSLMTLGQKVDFTKIGQLLYEEFLDQLNFYSDFSFKIRESTTSYFGLLIP